MAAFKVKNLWTAFLTAFFAVLTTLGLTAPAAAADAAVQQPADQPAKGGQPPVTAEERGGGSERGGGVDRGEGVERGGGRTAPAVQRALPDSARPADTSRPPTIEQRIRAEAHGSSPSVRRVPVDTRTDADVARDDKSGADAALSAAA
ncbi:hypothetical protein GCM10011583_11310 [Streptomyces camponoticapitis]|uniref:Uncharacterized protein n=1 Tax=Streptomyces camponoticapitis TaxID=1616125 RepID=A0ABQ2E224_9ACTN|nr:DUF6344 domain-containing protein [Streptomyces camponoticapitis]GGJ81596.1 hypothetical protein GCM10011583_11310 [Streptomyces camponoticapitis]